MTHGSALSTLLRVRGLTVTVRGADRPLLDDVSFDLASGSSVGIVGPSGAGKSTLALALMQLLPRAATMGARSEVLLNGEALHRADPHALRRLRGRRIAMIFQEPALALDPAMRIGEQVAESALAHGVDARTARARAVEMLDKVGFADAPRAALRYPHELSGGMRQRVLIASAMMFAPELLIADEPTTALDPTIQAQVLDLIDRLRAESGATLLLISHDLAVVAERCPRVIALERGRLVQDATAEEVLRERRGARPALVTPTSAAARSHLGVPVLTPLLDVRGLSVTYAAATLGRSRGTDVHAVTDMSLSVARGEVVALVGESGCGKSSTAHAILRLVEPAAGSVTLCGTDVRALGHEPLRQLRRRMQLVPQDAGASLTPHLTCGELVAEGLEVHGIASGGAARARAGALFAELGLPDRTARALPRQLSSGERQRVAIARALACDPELLVCDEPLASVDERARAQVLAVLESRRATRGMGILLISHDLDAVRRLADRVLVMYLGRIVEASDGASALTEPRMPYTQALVAAVPTGSPSARRRRPVLFGERPSSDAPPTGCAFHPRCPHPLKDDRCRSERPSLLAVAPDQAGHVAACWKVHLPPPP